MKLRGKREMRVFIFFRGCEGSIIVLDSHSISWISVWEI